MQCVDAAPAVFIAASTQDQIPPIGVHRTAVADASPCTALHEPDAGTSQATSDLHSPSAALPTPHTAQQQGSSGSAACNAQPSLPSLCYSCSHGGDVLCMELATGALVWSQHLPGRTAPGLCLHPHMLVWPLACTCWLPEATAMLWCACCHCVSPASSCASILICRRLLLCQSASCLRDHDSRDNVVASGWASSCANVTSSHLLI